MNYKPVFEPIYKFTGIEGLICDMNGNFTFNNKPCRRAYNNGSIQIRQGKFSKGLKTLRKLAYKSQQESIILPF